MDKFVECSKAIATLRGHMGLDKHRPDLVIALYEELGIRMEVREKERSERPKDPAALGLEPKPKSKPRLGRRVSKLRP